MVRRLFGVYHGCSGLIVGSIFFVLGAVFFVVFAQATSLDCARREPREIVCERESVLLGRVQMRQDSIRGLRGAWVDESCDDGCTYRVVLTTDEGDVPLTGAYTSDQRTKVEITRAINGFVEGDARTLQVEDRPPALLMALPILFMIIGPVATLASLFRF